MFEYVRRVNHVREKQPLGRCAGARPRQVAALDDRAEPVGRVTSAPTSTSVPTSDRTIFRKNRSARIVKHIVPRESIVQTASFTRQMLVLLFELSLAKEVKSSYAVSIAAASFIRPTSSGT